MKKILTFCIGAFIIIGTIKAQEKSTMSVKDLESSSTKYIKKNYKDFETTEAFKYNVIYLVKIQKSDTTEKLAFNSDGKFLYIMTEAIETKIAMQPFTSMAINDLPKDIEKYVKKQREGYKIVEAIIYDKVYTAVVVKGAEEVVLLFNSKGDFMQVVEPLNVAPEPVKQEVAPAPADTTKNQ